MLLSPFEKEKLPLGTHDRFTHSANLGISQNNEDAHYGKQRQFLHSEGTSINPDSVQTQIDYTIRRPPNRFGGRENALMDLLRLDLVVGKSGDEPLHPMFTSSESSGITDTQLHALNQAIMKQYANNSQRTGSNAIPHLAPSITDAINSATAKYYVADDSSISPRSIQLLLEEVEQVIAHQDSPRDSDNASEIFDIVGEPIMRSEDASALDLFQAMAQSNKLMTGHESLSTDKGKRPDCNVQGIDHPDSVKEGESPGDFGRKQRNGNGKRNELSQEEIEVDLAKLFDLGELEFDFNRSIRVPMPLYPPFTEFIPVQAKAESMFAALFADGVISTSYDDDYGACYPFTTQQWTLVGNGLSNDMNMNAITKACIVYIRDVLINPRGLVR